MYMLEEKRREGGAERNDRENRMKDRKSGYLFLGDLRCYLTKQL